MHARRRISAGRGVRLQALWTHLLPRDKVSLGLWRATCCLCHTERCSVSCQQAEEHLMRCARQLLMWTFLSLFDLTGSPAATLPASDFEDALHRGHSPRGARSMRWVAHEHASCVVRAALIFVPRRGELLLCAHALTHSPAFFTGARLRVDGMAGFDHLHRE